MLPFEAMTHRRTKEQVPLTFDWKHPAFRNVSAPVREALKRAGSLQRFKAGELLLQEGTVPRGLFVLSRGSVQVFYTSPAGQQVSVKIFSAPAMFGEMEALANIPYLESVEALETAEVLLVTREGFLAALQTSHTFALNLVEDLSARLCIAAQNERSLAFHSVEVRVANLLATYVDLYGLPVEGGIKIRIPLSQEVIGRTLGVARRSVTRALTRLSHEKVLKKAGRFFVVTSKERLLGLGDPEAFGIGYRLDSPLRPLRR